MKFSVGYRFLDESGGSFSESLCKLAPAIDEVYFPWPGSPSGRPSLGEEHGDVYWEGQSQLENDLKTLKAAGIKLNMLFNANCYGDKSVSIWLQNNVCSIIDHINNNAGTIDRITTTSPYIASIVKEYFPDIQTRASVNMCIGTTEGMEYLESVFDGYYMKREHNRDFSAIKNLKQWCDAHKKTLHLLANSGCMYNCSAQIFHDNTLAHHSGIEEMINKPGYDSALCRQFYAIPDNQWKLLRNTWIRPEDLIHYEKFFDTAKLATRQTKRPLHVVSAYIRGNYRGNVLDLLEPNHSKCLGERYISNADFPKEWFENTTGCDRNCEKCNFCRKVFDKTCVNV